MWNLTAWILFPFIIESFGLPHAENEKINVFINGRIILLFKIIPIAIHMLSN